jgi:hypothetical protein
MISTDWKTLPKKRRKQLRKFKPKPPAGGTLISSSGEWHLYESTRNGRFTNFKMVSVRPRYHKANFRFAFHNDSGMALQTRDLKTLKENAPEVLEWVLSEVAGIDRET